MFKYFTDRETAFKLLIKVKHLTKESLFLCQFFSDLIFPHCLSLPPPLSSLLRRNGDSQLFDKVRGHDIKLLRYLSVRYICDLMVENKKVKFGLK